MNYLSLNSSGGVVSQGGTGAGGIPSRSVIPFGTMWNTAGTASQYGGTYMATMNNNNASLGGTPFIYRFDRPAAIVGLNIVQCATPAGNTWAQLVKNNNVVASFNCGSNNGGTPAPAQTFANSVYTFAAGDVLQVNTMCDVAGNTQISGYVTVEWLA